MQREYRYAMYNRPVWGGLSLSQPYTIDFELTHPDIAENRRHHSRDAHSVLITNHPLTADEIQNMELVDIAADNKQRAHKAKLIEYINTLDGVSDNGKRALIVCGIVIFFGMGVASMTSATFAPFAVDNFEIAEDLIGTILTVMFVVFVLLQVGFNRLMKRVGEIMLAIIGLLLCVCGLLVLGFATSVPELFITGVFLGAGLGAISLGTLTLASKAAGKGQEGAVMGIYYTTFYASMGTIPIVCGALSDIFSVRLLFLGYAGLLFVLMFVVWLAGGSLRVRGEGGQ